MKLTVETHWMYRCVNQDKLPMQNVVWADTKTKEYCYMADDIEVIKTAKKISVDGENFIITFTV
jgi:hypothetical protein